VDLWPHGSNRTRFRGAPHSRATGRKEEASKLDSPLVSCERFRWVVHKILLPVATERQNGVFDIRGCIGTNYEFKILIFVSAKLSSSRPFAFHESWPSTNYYRTQNFHFPSSHMRHNQAVIWGTTKGKRKILLYCNLCYTYFEGGYKNWRIVCFLDKLLCCVVALRFPTHMDCCWV
jgi:hypothetical protein